MKSSILFGNGLNQLSTNHTTWDELLLKLKGNNGFTSKNTPNTMIYERILSNRLNDDSCKTKDIDSVEYNIKKEIAHALANQNSNELYTDLRSLHLSNYMTTNYDYVFKDSFDDSHEFINKSTETVYSLRRYMLCQNKKNNILNCNIWNIHGEMDHPISIKLGLDHYCGSIGKIDSYIKGNYKFTNNELTVKTDSIKEKLFNNNFDGYSWVELFFSSNVHILGLSLDFSETDLWWVLNKRARISSTGLVKNKIFYYVTDNLDSEKKELLESLYVHVVTIPLLERDYFGFYKKAIEAIKSNINKFDFT